MRRQVCTLCIDPRGPRVYCIDGKGVCRGDDADLRSRLKAERTINNVEPSRLAGLL